MVANIQNPQSSYILHNIEKTRIKPFAYYSISKGFQMVACDVGILYGIEPSYQQWSIIDELKEDLYDSIQRADIKGINFIVNWLTHSPHDCSIDLIFGHIATSSISQWKCSVTWLEDRSSENVL